MITVISTIKTTIKTHIATTWLATRGALIALFAGLFILTACGGGGGVNIAVNVTTPGCTDPFAEGCGATGAVARANAITACRLLIEDNKACADTIPDAVRACLTDPYSCDDAAYNAAIRTTDGTVAIGALQTGRTDDCRAGGAGATGGVTSALLCDGAIDNTCQPISRATDATRNQLIFDNLCNNAPKYIDARQAFIADCTDFDLFNNVGCTTQITTCTTAPFGANCRSDVYAGGRAQACRDAAEGSSTPDPRCAAENILATYCTANPFGVRAGCLTDDNFAGARITECTMGNNGAQERCKDTARFTDNTLIACFTDPYGTDCEGITGYDVTNARANRRSYCIGLGEEVGGESLCSTAVSNVCTGDDADIFNPICLAGYQPQRIALCQRDSSDGRCTATVTQLCDDNPFTRMTGSSTGYLCTDAADATARADLVTRCASENSDQTGCDAGVGTTNVSNCIEDPYALACTDVAFNDLKTERYNHCISGAPTKNCTGTIRVVCTDDRMKLQPLANPFHALCRDVGSIAGLQGSFCAFRRGERPECVPSITREYVDRGFVNGCINNPFTARCLTSNSFTANRAVIIADCLLDTPVNQAKCDLIIDGRALTVAMCVADPFANGCSTNTGFDATRDARTMLCSASGTPFDPLCDNFSSRDTERETHCTTERTSFTKGCEDSAYPNTAALRASFCGKTANLFEESCEGNSGVDAARSALALLCFTNAEAEGCDQFVNGVSGATVAQCSADPVSVAKGCPSYQSFDTLRENRIMLCETSGDGQDPFNSLCENFPLIADLQEAYCSSGAGSFNMNCALDYPAETVMGRRAFALSCRTPPIAPACATTIVAGSVTVAHCIENPYQRACYGTANNRNPDFIDEVADRDALCRNGGDIYNSLCLNSAGMEIVEGIIADRVAGCTTPAQSAFNENCTETAYRGTEDAQRGYCSTLVTASGTDIIQRCLQYSESICGADADANPFAAICTDNSVNQIAFCNLGQNAAGASNPAAQCTNDPVRVCPIDPFNETAGIDGTVNCKEDATIPVINARAERCAAGTQGAGECNELNSVSRVCVASGSRANPFASFCNDAVLGDMAKTEALETAKATFASACASASASQYCDTRDVRNALCSSSGEFVRPFANTCAGPVGVGARVSFCGAGDNVTSDSRCRDDSIIALACRADPFSDACETTASLVFQELRELRAEHCETLSLDDVLCTTTAANFICRDGYVGTGGSRVEPNLLSGVCTQPEYLNDRRDACLGLNSKNAVCDDIPEVADACRPNPFDITNPGCAFISQAGDLQSEYCQGANTWQSVCDTLADEETEGVNDVVVARVNECLNLTSGIEADCKALSSVGEACAATPFAKGCIIFTGTVLDGYELAYCQTAATAWDVGCDDLDAAGGNMVSAMRSSACNDATQADDEMLAGYFSPRCNTLESFRTACSSDPFDATTPGCAFHENFEDLAASYCSASGTTWQDACDMRAELNEGINDVSTARLGACLVADTADAACPSLLIVYCDDTDNSANAFEGVCGNVGNSTDRAAQLQKACAEGGLGANSLCTDQARAKVYCTTIDPYAGIGCEELAGDSEVMTFRASYCMDPDNTDATGCGEIADVCADNPFDGRCVDESPSQTYATARKTRADECRDNTKSGDDCLGRVNACNARPFSATPAHIPTTGTATTCSSDPAFVDTRAALVTKCIVVNAVNDDPDCENAVADQKEVNANGASCLENPYSMLVNCELPTQLGSRPNVMTARASFCRTTTGSNSFSGSCDSTNADIIKARAESCFDDGTAHGTCTTVITSFCTATTGASAFDNRCTGRTNNALVRTTLCVNGTEHANCPTIGASFTAWADAVEADMDVDILDAGAGVNADPVANFIKGVLNADGKLHVKDGVSTSLEANANLASDYKGVALRGDAEDGFALATADIDGDSTHRLYVGILHTTNLGAPITTDTGTALWKGVIRVLRYRETDPASAPESYSGDFVLSIDFSTRVLAFDGNDGRADLTGATLSILTGTTFDRATGLITGSVSLVNTARSLSVTGTLRGIIGEEGAVGVFASPMATTFGDIVGGFVASAVDRVIVCPIETNPFGEGCELDVAEVLTAQFLACSTGARPDNLPIAAVDCNHADLSGVICDDNIAGGSKADPFAEICTDAAITIKTNPSNFANVRATVRTHCADVANVLDTVCMARVAQLARLDVLCVATDESTLFGARCTGYSEYAHARALICRKRESGSTLTCNTPEIIAEVCNVSTGEAANPFDVICTPTTATYAGGRKLFASRCARDFAKDPRAIAGLDGADCKNTGLNSVCLADPFATGCDTNEDYELARSDRIAACRGDETLIYSDNIYNNIFGYECDSAIINVCGSPITPTDAVLFNDKLCTNEDAYDTRREAIVADCVADKATTNEECEFGIVIDQAGMITKKVSDCLDSPYDVACVHIAFDDRRTAVLGGCESAFTGADCRAVQVSVCGGGVYADNPFDAFCDKKDTADATLTIDPTTLASQRIRYCQDSANRAANVDGCAEFLTRATTTALLDAQNPQLGESPNTVSAENQFLRGTADGLNTGGFIRKDGQFAFVSKLNLKTATHNGVALDGDAADGVAYFAGRRHITQGDVTTNVNYYAGIHSGTDLGAPLPRQYDQDGVAKTVNWNGRIGWLVYDSVRNDGYAFDGTNGTDGVTDFTLTINLTERSILANITRTAVLSSPHGFFLQGDYDENGVISGIARYGAIDTLSSASTALYNGFLIGLIGEQGAVGAFHLTGSGAEATHGATGGFVASASVAGSGRIEQMAGSINYWIVNREDEDGNAIVVLETSDEIGENNPDVNFIIGSAKGSRGIAMVDAQDQNTLKFSAGSSNGLAYGFADYGSGGSKVEKFYVGLLSSTNVGTPITMGASPTLSWGGRLAIAKQDNQGSEKSSYLTETDFTLLITFVGSGGTITTPDTDGNRIEFSRSIYDTSSARTADEFVIDGTFNEFGLISGTTTYYANNGGTKTPLEGVLTGLIGAQGAVGVFTSKAAGAGAVGHYVGGFVASEAFGLGGVETWQNNAVEEVITTPGGVETSTLTPLIVKAVRNAEQSDGDYTFIGGGSNTLDLGSATKSTTLTRDLTFDENLILENGDVFSINSTALGGISIAQATIGGDTQYYAGLLANIFVGLPLQTEPSVNWQGVISIIAGGDVPALYTNNFTLVVNFSIKTVYSNTTFLRTLGNVNHDIELSGKFTDKGVIYGTATYQVGDTRNVGLLSGLIGINGAAAVFGGDAGDPGRFVGGLVAVPSGTTLLTPRSQFVWAEGIDETVFENTRFNAGVTSFSSDDNTITWKEDDDDEVEIVTTDANAINVDTTFLGGVDNVDGTADGFVVFTTTDNNIRTQHVGILSGTNLGRPVVNTGGVGSWSARMAGLVIAGSFETAFNTDFTLSVDFANGTISADQSDLPAFEEAGNTFSFNFMNVEWNTGTGIFKSGITLTANTATGEKIETGILRGIIGADGAIGTFKVSEDPGTGGRTFIGGFVAVPESIGARRGQPAYWAQYARNADNTAGLAVKAIRTARPTDGTYTLIEGGLETLELGLEVAKNAKADLTYDLTFNNTEVSPDGSTLSFDPSVAGGISFSALETRAGKFYVGLLSGTDVGRLQSRSTLSAIWVGRFGIIDSTTGIDNELFAEDFELAIDFGERTLKSSLASGTAGVADLIVFETDGNLSLGLIIDGEFNDRGIIYGTTAYQVVSNTGSVIGDNAGALTGLIGEKGAAAVFYSTSTLNYVGGFIAVPNRGDLTRVDYNPPASYSIWAEDIDATTQKTTRSGTDTASDANTSAFTIEVPETLSDTNQISLNLAPFGGDGEDGVFGYADTPATARHIGLLSSTNLGGLLSDTDRLGAPIYTGTATWEGVMQLIIGNGGATGVVTQGFTIDVNFDTQALTFADSTFTSNSVAYDLALSLAAWDVDSGLFTGTINITATAANPAQVSSGSVRGIIGKDGLVAAFRSATDAYSSFTGGFVATAIRASETSFIEYFSSIAGGEVLEDFADGTTAKFARPSGNSLRLADGSPLADSSAYRLGASAASSAGVVGGSGFVVSTDAANLAVGILPSTDLGAPLPLILAKTVTWTGRLYRSNNVDTTTQIMLSVNFAEGTIKTTAAVPVSSGGDTLTIDGYFGLNPLALAAKLPQGFLGGLVTYTRSSAPHQLTLIGQIGGRGVVGIFGGLVNTTQLVGGFSAISSGATANGREFNIKQRAVTSSYTPSGSIDYSVDDDNNPITNGFVVADKNGSIPTFAVNGETVVATPHLFGLGGDNDPATNPNGFTLGQGFFVVNRIGAGIWAGTDLGLLLPTAGASAIWTGTVQTLKVSGNRVGNTVGGVVGSDFKIQVDFANSTISTLDADDAKGAVETTDCISQACDTIRFDGVSFDANGIIKELSNRVEYKIGGVGTAYGLRLIGIIGQRGAIGVFNGNLASSNGIVGGFEVTPSGRVMIEVEEDRVSAPKQLNYAAYLKYYFTDYIDSRHGSGIRVEPRASATSGLILSQFVASNDLGSAINTGTNSSLNFDLAGNFSPFTVHLNGADTATRNSFTLAVGNRMIVIPVGQSLGSQVETHSYAGLSAGADVGRFSDALAGTTVNWSGTFYSSAFVAGSGDTRAPARFPIRLAVDFGAGTIGTGGDFTLLQGHSINIAGTFGTARGDENQGILGGFITYTGPNDDAAKRITRAPLYGIIGDAGALGVFASGKYGADGDGADSPLVGGFEVSPNPIPTANYALFYNYFVKQTNGLQLRNTVTQKSSILAGTRTGLVQEGINDPATCVPMPDQCIQRLGYQTIRLGGDERSNSGFAIMGTKTNAEGRGYSYGGLLSGTNLGAILPVSFGSGVTKAIWHGSFYVTSNKIERADSFFDTLLHHPLSLTVDLAAGTLQTVDLLGNLGTVALTPNSSVRINGKFGLSETTANVPYGLLLGDVRVNTTDYALIGLIGVDGAIGIFRTSATQTTHVTVGGFEVTPPPPPAYGRGNYATFEDFYRKRAATADRYLTPSRTADTDQFVRGLRIGLIDPADGTLEAGSFAPLSVYLGGNANSGNAFIIENFNGTHVVGLLGTTDLGFAPHENLASATWLGNFYVSNNVATTGTDGPAPLEIKSGVKVDFGAGTLTSTQETYTLANTQFISFGIYGEFGEQHELPLGILDGIVKYGHHATDASLIMTADLRDLPLIGVIGRAGALGIFRDPSDNNLVGGFEAGISTDHDVFREGSRGAIKTGLLISPSRFGNSSTIQRAAVFEVNDAGTGFKAEAIKYDTTGTPPGDQWPTKRTGTQIAGFATGTKYGFGDDPESLSGFILAGVDVMTIPTNVGTPTNVHTQQTLRIVGAGFLPTSTLGAAILDITGSATWRGGKAYVLDTVDATTKVFNVDFTVNFAKGTFNTAGAVAVASKIGADGMPVTTGQTGQTLLIEGKFGQGAPAFSAGFLTSGRVLYYNGAETAVQTNALYGLIGRGGAVAIFQGGGQVGANNGYAGGFWVRPGATEGTTLPEVKYATYLSHYRAEIKDSVNIPAEPSGRVEFFNGTTGATGGLVVQQNLTFRLGGDDADAANENGLRFNVFRNLKTVGLLGQTDLGAVLPNTTASATWYGRLFAKTDATAFNADNEKQIRLDVDFSEGTIDTPAPVNFTIGEETHSVSIRGRFGLHDFVRRSSVPTATGLLSGFVEYTHYETAAVRFDLIGIIGAEGALGIFKGNVADVGLVGGFEVTPDSDAEIAARGANHATYLTQFESFASINDPLKDGSVRSQIVKGEAHKLKFGGAPEYFPTFRLGGDHSDANTDAADTTNLDGFAMAVFTAGQHKGVGILSGTDLGTPVTSSTPSAIWAGRLYVNPAYTADDTTYASLDLRVDFGAGTIETLQPITIVAYKAGNPAVHKQSLEINGRFGSHLDAFGLRTGTLGGTVSYTVGHYALDANLTNLTVSQRTLAMTHRRVTARLPLIGLIGTDGAIGVFHGTVADDAFTNVHVIGGFEVSPRAELSSTITASFERWARGATQCGAIDARVSTFDFDTECATTKAIIFAHPNDLFLSDEDFSGSNTKRQGFVLGNAVGIDLTRTLTPTSGLTLKTLTLGDDAIFNNVGERFTLNTAMGDATDGVAFIGDSFDNSIYAGLLSGTDLGAPLALNSALQVSWPGRLVYLVNGVALEDGDFVLTVDFANRRISGDVAVASGLALQGSYDEFGVITGIIKAKQSRSSTGSVSGLIGVEGAVGAFVINTSDRFRVGGFVAAPVAKIKVTSYAHFADYYKDSERVAERTLHPSSIAAVTIPAAFVVGTEDGAGLDTNGLTFREPMGEFQSTAYKLGGDVSSPDGFALANGALASGFDKRLRAGILSGTDLGPVVSARVNGLWTGTANVTYANSTTSASEFHSFTLILDVDFAAGMINTVTDGVSGTDGLQVEGRFGVGNIAFNNGDGTALPQGILGGQVTYKFGVGNDDPELTILPLIGLIGGDGAVGVFTKTSGVFSYAGGFTAQPFALTPAAQVPAPAAIVVGVLQDFATLPTTGSTTSGGFVKLGSTFTNTDVATFAPTGSTSNNTTITLDNDIEFTGGVAYFALTDSDGGGDFFYYYAGILANTNLGEPVASTDPTARWIGVFSEHNSRTSDDENNFIGFHVNFGAGTLQFRNTADNGGGGTLTRGTNTYTLNARFGHGVIDEYNNTVLTTGQLGGRITRTSDNKTAAISGLIGKKGAVGAFVNPADASHFAGGFWAVPKLGIEDDLDDEVVDFGDWERGFGRRHDLPRRLTSPQTSEFLAGRETVVNENGLDDTGRTNYGRVVSGAKFAGGTIARFAFAFGSDSLTYGGYPLGGDATGGVAGFWQANGAHRYAGLLSSTNVGAPINSALQTGAWRGRFVVYRAISNLIFTTRTDFTLNVTFKTGGGGTLTMANITDSQTSYNYYSMTGGEFDERGFISGKINLHHKTSSTSEVTLTDSGFLTGLIGADGAAGVFIGGRGTIDDIQLHSARSGDITRFVGGFVATGKRLIDAPDSPSANHAQFNWYYKNYGSGDRKLSASFADSGADVRTAFLEGSVTGLNLPVSDLPRQKNLTVVKLRGDVSSPSGFAFVSGNITTDSANERFRVGLLSDTNLGAAFTIAPELLTWTGSIHLLSDAGVVRTTNRPFTLNFTDGTLTTPDLAIGTNDTIRIAGTFRVSSTINSLLGVGVLGGSAFFTDTSATTTTELPLIGLIGADGAIGVFHAAALGVGGFEAGPPVPAPCIASGNCLANYDAWVAATTITPLASGAAEPPAESRFLTSTGDRLDTEDIPGNSTSVNLSTATNGGTALGGDTTDGFAYSAVNELFLVGITETTDLGAPVDATTVLGTWNGSFVSVVFNSSVPAPTTTDFTLAVTFGDTALGNAGSVASGTIGTTGYVFEGEFDASGVISGTTAHAGNGGGILRGLIGVKGAVGVFISDVGATKAYAGGFVAKPTPPDPCIALRNCPAVEFAAWEATFDTGGVNEDETLQESGFTNGERNNDNYIKLNGEEIKIVNDAMVARTFTSNVLRLSDTVGEPGYESGIAYAVDLTDFNDQGYAGILATTNLGAPLVDNTKNSIWTGKLGARYSGGEGTIPVGDLSLQVTFGGTSSEPGSLGTITTVGSDGMKGSTIVSGNAIKVDGDFNAAGVMWGDFALGNNDNDNASFSGLIGEKGAVGVFKGSTSTLARQGYVGGFWVKPPAPSP